MIKEPYRTNILKFLTVIGVLGYAVVVIGSNEKFGKTSTTVSPKRSDIRNVTFTDVENTNIVRRVPLEKQDGNLQMGGKYHGCCQ